MGKRERALTPDERETSHGTMSKMMTRSTTTMKRFGRGTKPTKTSKNKGTVRQGGVGYKKFEGRPLYLPDIEPPTWLDGSMIGDRGFDPLGLSKPTEYIQMDIDQLDQNKAINKPGAAVGTITPDIDQVSGDSLSPYSEAFGIQRFRECELIHGRLHARDPGNHRVRGRDRNLLAERRFGRARSGPVRRLPAPVRCHASLLH